MNVVALRTAPIAPDPVHLLGRVIAFTPDGQVSVEDESGTVWHCRRAASCLLKPEPGDTVMLSGPDRLRVYLIAVIEQADASVSRIDAAGDMVLGAGAGSVTIESARDLRLHCRGQLDMKASEWALQAGQAHCRVDGMRYTGQDVDATVGRVRLFGKVLETMVDRAVQMARNAFRLVDETEQVRVGQLDIEATQTVRVHAQHTLVTGTDLVKVDASQIHMG
jgi:hypothetical protein